MKKTTIIILALAISFGSGFAFKSVITKNTELTDMKKVTGIGGIFFKCKDPKYGKFIHIMDIEANKIELWEPNEPAYDKIVTGRTK